LPTKQKKDEFTSHWMTQIKSGLEYRKKYSVKDKWETYRKYYRGQWAESIVPINKIFSYGRMLIPRVYFRAPRVTVTASRPDLIWHAKVVEALDNLLIKELMLKQTLKMSALDCYLCGIGAIKLGYDSEFGYIPEQSVTDGGETVTQQSTTEEGERIEYHETIKPGMPWALRVRPDDVIVPWGSSDAQSLPWVAHYILRPLDDVKQDQKYRNTADLQGTRAPTMGEDARTKESFRPRNEREKGITYCELWEVRDCKTKQILVFSEDKLLMSVPDALQTQEGIPWEFVVFNPDPEYFWPIPDTHIIAPQQEELNATSTQTSRHRAISLVKFLYKQNALDKEELAKMLSGEVGPAVAVKEVETLASAVMILQPHIPPDLYTDMQSQIQSMREELGFSQNQEGSFSPYHGKTASESMIVAESFEARVDERKDIMSDVLVRIIRKWNWFLFQFWSESKVVQIVSPEGEPAWVQYTGDQLKGDYMLSIDADSGMPVSRALKQQLSGEMFKALNGDQLIDQVLLRQIVLESFSMIDPRVPQLLQTQFAGAPQMLSADRQPSPATGSGGGKGSGGGRSGQTPQNPVEFDKFKARMEQK
jgi:hypothetical protein